MPDPLLLDAVADRLARRLLVAHVPDRAYGRADLGALPPAVARVLGVGLDHTAEALAREALPETPWLDGAHPAVQAAVAAWPAAAHAAVRYPAEAWAEAVTAASHVALRLLVHPADGLASVALDGADDEQPAAAVLARVRAASPYAYLPDVAARYAERKGLAALDRPALERLLARIDRRMADTLTPDDWLALAEPLFETVGPDGTPPQTLPPALVRTFLEARGQGARAAALPDAPVSREALRAAVAGPVASESVGPEVDANPEAEVVPDSSALPDAALEPETPVAVELASPDDVPPAAEPPAAPSVPPEETPARPAPPEASAPAVAPPDEPLWRRLARQHGAAAPAAVLRPTDGPPLWQRFATPSADPMPTLAPDTPAAYFLDDLPAEPAPADSVEGEPIAAAPVAAAEPVEAAPDEAVPDEVAPDTPDAVEARVLGPDGAARRDWFVAELFGGDAEAYAQTLVALDGATSWTDATQIIARDVFRRYRVQLYAGPAVAFTDAVETALARRAGPSGPRGTA